MRKSRIVVDEAAVKKVNNEASDWTAVCSVCGKAIVGTLCQLLGHKHGQ